MNQPTAEPPSTQPTPQPSADPNDRFPAGAIQSETDYDEAARQSASTLDTAETAHSPATSAPVAAGDVEPRPHHMRQASGATSAGSGRWPRLRDSLLWIWPVAAVAAIAGLGQWFGPLGTILGVLVALTVLVNLVGHDFVPKGVRLTVAAVCLVLAGLALIASAGLVDAFTTHAPTRSGSIDLRGKRLSATDVTNRRLAGALLDGAVLDGLDLTGADLAGVTAPGASLRKTTLERVRLGKANLRGASLEGANLRGADLRDADLSGVNLRNADLRDADLRGACLIATTLIGAMLDRTDITDADVRGANLGSGATPPAGWPTQPSPSPRC